MATTGEVAAWLAAGSAGTVALIGALSNRLTSKTGRQTEIEKMFSGRLEHVETQLESSEERNQALEMEILAKERRANDAEVRVSSLTLQVISLQENLAACLKRGEELKSLETRWESYQQTIIDYQRENIELLRRLDAEDKCG